MRQHVLRTAAHGTVPSHSDTSQASCLTQRQPVAWFSQVGATEVHHVLHVQIVAAHSPSRGLALLQWDSELYTVSALLVQGASLVSNDATLAESLYGLRRVPIGTHSEHNNDTRLASWQRLLSLLIAVGALS